MKFQLPQLGRKAARRGPPQGQPQRPPQVPGHGPAQAKSASPAAAPPGQGPAQAAPDPRIDAVGQRVAELAERVQGIAAAIEGMRQDTAALGQRLREGDEKFLRLLGLLEAAQAAENPFVDAGAPPRGPPSPVAPRPREAPPAEVPRAEALPSEAPAIPPPAEPPGAQPPGPAPEPAPARVLAPLAPAPPWPPGASLEESVVLLEWADMLLGAVDRAALGHLLDWYEAIGWLPAGLKASLLRCAEGIHAASEEPGPRRRDEAAADTLRAAHRGPPPWRQDLEVHYRSLAFAARLRGDAPEERMRIEEALRQAVAIRAA